MPGTNRRRGSTIVVAMLAVALTVSACGSKAGKSSGDAGSGKYPSKPLTLIVQADAGGTSDLVARTAAGLMEKSLGESIVVENRPGAAGSTAMNYVAKQPADGYTVGYLPVEVSYLAKAGYPSVDPENYTYIGQTNQVAAALAVRADSDLKTLDDFIKAAKAKPGSMSVGNSGPGSIWHIATGAIEQDAHVKLNPVPFDGGAPAVAALMGGKIDAVTVGTSEVLSNVKSGDLRVLAVLSDERAAQLPKVQTAAQQGHDIQVLAWGGLGVPKGTPQPVVDKLSAALQKAVASPEFKSKLAKTGNDPVWRGPDQFQKFVLSESARYQSIVQDLDLPTDD